jgi:hypothetical protein
VIVQRCGACPPVPRLIRYIDKRKAGVIINPSYFGKLSDLPIDKIDIMVLKYYKPLKGVAVVRAESTNRDRTLTTEYYRVEFACHSERWEESQRFFAIPVNQESSE